MRVNLLTDAPRHNLALMRISAYHKSQGDEVILNQPLMPANKVYASWLFIYSHWYPADILGGPGYDPRVRLPAEIETMSPDYSLFPIDYSLGYTWEYCHRNCPWCVVSLQQPPQVHHSIWEFHDTQFDKICLLNNNTFTDPRWRETFEEIWEAGLKVVDQNGYDLRLLDEEKAKALRRTKFHDRLYFSWDRMEDEAEIRRGLGLLVSYGVRSRQKCRVYVMVGYPGGRPIDDSDIHRCQVIADYGFDPFVMIFNNDNNSQLRWFRWLANWSFSWRKLGFRRAWEEGYRPEKRRRQHV